MAAPTKAAFTWLACQGVVHFAIGRYWETNRAPDDSGLDRIAPAAARRDFQVNVLFWGNVEAGTALIASHHRLREDLGDPATPHPAQCHCAGPCHASR